MKHAWSEVERRNVDVLQGETEPVRIVEAPGVCGGRPRIEGTRIEPKSVASFRRAGFASQEIVDKAYPHLTVAQLDAALEWYDDHPEARIDEDSDSDEDARLGRRLRWLLENGAGCEIILRKERASSDYSVELKYDSVGDVACLDSCEECGHTKFIHELAGPGWKCSAHDCHCNGFRGLTKKTASIDEAVEQLAKGVARAQQARAQAQQAQKGAK